MEKPIIIITPQNKPMEEPFEAMYNYTNTFNMRAVAAGGGVPLIPAFPGEEDADALMQLADGLFMTGGADVDPAMYGEEKLPECEDPQPERDRSDLILLRAALKYRKPVLCICRGCQIANVFFGGTLYQDIERQKPGSLRHPAWEKEEYRIPTHEVKIAAGTPLRQLFGADTIGVNSLHHQAIRELGAPLRAMAEAPDGIIESWYLPSEVQWIRAYQWHPEMMKDHEHRNIVFRDFISACRKAK